MKNYYIRLEMELMKSDKWSMSQKILLGILFALTQKGKIGTTKTNRYLAVNLRMNPQTISRLLSLLAKHTLRIDGFTFPVIVIKKNDYLQREISFNRKAFEYFIDQGYVVVNKTKKKRTTN